MPRHSIESPEPPKPVEVSKPAEVKKPPQTNANIKTGPGTKAAAPLANNKNGAPVRVLNQKQKDKEKELEKQRELEKQKEIEKERERQKELEREAAANAEPVKEYADTLIGSSTGLNYFCIWSKYYYYVYDKKCRLIKAEKLPFPIIQIEVIENKSVENYGIELEMVLRAEDCRDDEEKERDNLIFECMLVLDPFKLPKRSQVISKESDKPLQRSKSKDKKQSKQNAAATEAEAAAKDSNVTVDLVEKEIMRAYIPSANRLEIHSCVTLTRDKKKMFTCTEIGDNVVECFRNRVDKRKDAKPNAKPRNLWKYHGALDDNLDRLSALVLSDDENYMLAVVPWGFKVTLLFFI